MAESLGDFVLLVSVFLFFFSMRETLSLKCSVRYTIHQGFYLSISNTAINDPVKSVILSREVDHHNLASYVTKHECHS